MRTNIGNKQQMNIENRQWVRRRDCYETALGPGSLSGAGGA
jgi:hypothetical protein